MRVLLVQIDGKLPNLALMKLSHWHKANGDVVGFTRSIKPLAGDMLWPDVVYGSAIFTKSAPRSHDLLQLHPHAILGGTAHPKLIDVTVESLLGVDEYEHYDYSLYPEYPWSIGFTQRGCRLNCGFCVVPKKEGRPRSLNTIADIHRPGTPKNIVLLDNDFFGQARDQWEARIDELREGGYRVSFNQGVNIRLVDGDAAAALASVQYYDDQFKTRRLYTAWDNARDEKIFFRGLQHLNDAGIPSRHVMVYMLVGYAPDETMERIMYRFQRLVDVGCRPYPMVYDRSKTELVQFQRWAIRRYYTMMPWEDYDPHWRPAKKSSEVTST